MILSPENQEADLSLSLNFSLKMLCEGLYIATCVFTSLTSQCKMTCLLILVFWNPTYFTAVAFLLQEHAGSECSVSTWLICWNWNQECFLPSIPAQLLQEFSVAPATERCLNQTKLMVGIYQNGEFFPEVRHKMTFILSRPSSSLNRGEMCYHWLFRSNSVTFCLSASYSVTCH